MQEKDKNQARQDDAPSEEMEFGETLEEPTADPDLQEAAGEEFTSEEARSTEFGERIGEVETPDDFETYNEELRRNTEL